MSQRNAALPLPFSSVTELPPAANSRDASQQKQTPLWLCIHLPRFSLEVLGHQQTEEKTKPQIVLYELAGRCLVYAACEQAEQMGIVPHMALNAAYALCPELQSQRRNFLQEQTQLKRLADWAYQFTPMVSVVEPQSLLLEVGGSLRLFGGLPNLLARIQQTMSDSWMHQVNLAVAPTPQASQMLANYAQNIIIEELAELRSVLGALPVEALLLSDPRLLKKLNNIGISNLKDLWRLPRDGLARRFGQGLIKHLDQLLGLLPDPRVSHEVPLQFDDSIELPMEASDKKNVLHAAEQIIFRLTDFLQRHDAGVNRLLLRLYHYDHSPSHVVFGLRQCQRDPAQLLALLHEKLDQVYLPSPVSEVRLMVKDILPFVGQNKALFSAQLVSGGENTADPDWEGLLEQLQNRLGREALQYLAAISDHRPEHAWSYQDIPQSMAPSSKLFRPSWLLPKARPLAMRDGIPCCRGKLQCLWGPERIQSGWWEGQEICRDYYIARDLDNTRLWVYRDLNQQAQWYLHGFFG